MADQELEIIEEESFDIIEFLQNLWKHKAVIIALALAAAALMFVKTSYFTDDTFTASGILHVSNKAETAVSDDTIQKSDLDTSKSLSSTYIEILKTRAFLTDISDTIGNAYTWEQLQKLVNISAVNETELLRISATTESAIGSYWIVEAFMEKAPDKLTSVYKGGEVEIVDPPVMPEAPNDKGMVNNLLIGFVLGAVAGIAYAFLFSFFDRKVHKSEDIAKRYNVSILGEISQ